MKLRDLNENNLVLIEGSNKPMEIDYFEKDIVFFKGSHFGKDISELMPIVLNNFWFPKLGFEEIKHTSGYYFHSLIRRKKSNVPSIVIYKDYTLLGNGTSTKHLEYVHTAQNLFFALTGEELKIK